MVHISKYWKRKYEQLEVRSDDAPETDSEDPYDYGVWLTDPQALAYIKKKCY